MGGMNPKFKDFIEKHPDKTVIGVGWAFYWRFMVLVLTIELIIFISILALLFALGDIHVF